MKIKTRLLFAALLFAVGPMSTWAQNAVAIHQVDGQVATFAFTEKPVVTYSGNDLVLTTTKTSVQYPIYMLKKIDFDVSFDDLTGIESVEKKADAQFRFQDGMISVVGGESGSQVFLYSMSGTKVGQYRLDGSGHIDIPVQHLSKGIYIIRTKHFTFKFRKS